MNVNSIQSHFSTFKEIGENVPSKVFIKVSENDASFDFLSTLQAQGLNKSLVAQAHVPDSYVMQYISLTVNDLTNSFMSLEILENHTLFMSLEY